MDKETYKVAVNLLARYGDKPNKSSFALTPTTPIRPSSLNHSLPTSNLTQRSALTLLSSSPQIRTTSTSSLPSPRPQLSSQISATSSPSNALMLHSGGANQQLRRRTPFPIINQQEKGVFDRIVDVLIGDGPQDRFAMICKECYSHNGMALKDDFEYTTFRCAFCNALNPARKNRPVAPRLSVLPPPPATTVGSDTSDSEDDKDDSDEEISANSNIFDTPTKMNNSEVNSENNNTLSTTLSSSMDEEGENVEEENAETSTSMPSPIEKVEGESIEALQAKADLSLEELVKQLEKSAAEDAPISPQ